MTLDTPTLFTSVTIACFSGACVLGLFTVSISGQTRAVRYSSLCWSAALLLLGIGCTLVGLRGQIPDSISIVTANALLLIGHNLRPAALRIFFEEKHKLLWIGFAASLGWIVLCQVPAFRDSFAARTLYCQFLLIANSLHIVWLCLKKAPAGMTTPKLLAGITALELGAYGLHSANQILHPSAAFIEIFSLPVTTIYLISLITCTVLSSVLIAAISLERAQLMFQEQATRDHLTGLRNRRSFFDEAEKWREARRRSSATYGLLVIDIDKLSSVNEQFGHALGDAMLQLLSRICLDTVEKPCLVGRIGNEKFALFLPEKDNEAASAIATRISRLMTTKAAKASGDRLKITISSGLFIGTSETSLERAFEIATCCMGKAKANGRNKTIASSGEMTTNGLQTTQILSPFSLTQRSVA
ncbi:GGDEF domain-containing protein [Roseibium suaedae]|uniref:diguanylate cyclase n=1 Tax=Roseibium suaedae TaxID=735517 RepID=A0A1M7CKC5_9HYPH|nr:GGDEF domain-containing protein [Roseibium suaedae]SHL67676.1 diguanylate cyclase (GGDEF) domain-containing protein [Roseibium suaedae]